MASRHLSGDPLTGHISLPVVGGAINRMAFSRDGHVLASASNDRTVGLWDIPRRQALSDRLKGHVDSVRGVAFSSNGKILASTGDDYTVRLWDVASWQPLGQPLSLYPFVGESVAFSPDGKLLASSGQDKTIWLWDVDFRSLAARLCRLANRNLSVGEWRRYIGSDIPYRRTCTDLPPGEGASAK